MSDAHSVSHWIKRRGMTLNGVVESTALNRRLIEAILAQRYTPSPQQRQRIASALDVTVDEIQWGHAAEVDHMYGHGPQFGRSP